ncbi:MAG: tRNA (guanosine(46)-N7)-methyltransferase TrmB [Deltaproteobacteria bacterium GWA2_50_8]|nr:MAG: tRNA (guanosine(46)-N7)-methyltransferase TrmB [Deltaproteobacteria bacterium GWA2_50_8]
MMPLSSLEKAYIPQIETHPAPLPPLKNHPLILEIGPGRGDFLFQLAEENPRHFILAIEYKNRRYEKLVQRIEKRRLANVLLVKGEARFVLKSYLKDILFEKVFILFSDPWPKKRHAKHRLIEAEFLSLLSRLMCPGGELIVTTDDESYAQWMQREFEKVPCLLPTDKKGQYPTIFETFYAQKWKGEGRSLNAFCFVNGPY